MFKKKKGPNWSLIRKSAIPYYAICLWTESLHCHDTVMNMYGTKGGCKEVWPECMVWCGYHLMSLSLMSLPMTPHEALVFFQEYLSHQLRPHWTSPREADKQYQTHFTNATHLSTTSSKAYSIGQTNSVCSTLYEHLKQSRFSDGVGLNSDTPCETWQIKKYTYTYALINM